MANENVGQSHRKRLVSIVNGGSDQVAIFEASYQLLNQIYNWIRQGSLTKFVPKSSRDAFCALVLDQSLIIFQRTTKAIFYPPTGNSSSTAGSALPLQVGRVTLLSSATLSDIWWDDIFQSAFYYFLELKQRREYFYSDSSRTRDLGFSPLQPSMHCFWMLI